MKTFVTSVMFLAMSTIIHAQAKIFFKNTTVEYKNVKLGSNEVRVFVFKNTGNKPLKISKVISTTRHVKAVKPTRKIAPGKTGKIKVIFDATQKGPIRRTITVFSNAKNRSIIALKIKGFVVKPNAA